jgi:hypothetical protein
MSSAAYYAANLEKVKAYNTVYYAVNRKKVKAGIAAYRAKYLEKVKIREAAYRAEHREEAKVRSAVHRKANPNCMIAWREEHREELKAYKRVYETTRRKTDIEFRIASNLRSRTTAAIRYGRKNGSAVRDLGISIPEFKVYIESLFMFGMSWGNYGREGWHLDHIIPLTRFNLTDREQFLKAAHYSNYQPLWAKDNIVKGNR